MSAGWEHVKSGHFNRELASNRSVFTLPEEQVKDILQSDKVVQSPVTAMGNGIYKRTADTGVVLGKTKLNDGGNPTTFIDVFTDEAGNLLTTYPTKGL